MDSNDWAALGIAFTVLMFWVGALHKRLSSVTDLSEKYVPRSQVDSRFAQERSERKEDMREIKDDMREIREGLREILDKIDGKVDK